jgi:hypothetical protein
METRIGKSTWWNCKRERESGRQMDRSGGKRGERDKDKDKERSRQDRQDFEFSWVKVVRVQKRFQVLGCLGAWGGVQSSSV